MLATNSAQPAIQVQFQECLAGGTNEQSSSLTSAKIKTIALAFFAAVSFGVGAALLAINAAELIFFAIPAFLVGGALVWAIYNVKDYEDPALLKQYKEKADKAPIADTVYEHSWENIFKHELINNERFLPLLETAAQEDFAKFLSVYDGGVEAAKRAGINHFPIAGKFDAYWREAAKDLNTSQVFEKFNVSLLVKYGFCDAKLLDAHKQYEEATESLLLAKKGAEATYKEEMERVLTGSTLTLALLEEAMEGFKTVSISISGHITRAYEKAKNNRKQAIEKAERTFEGICRTLHRNNSAYLNKA